MGDGPVCYVVDDMVGVRNSMSRSLRKLGWHVLGFDSVPNMLPSLLKEHPEIIFLDILLDKDDAVSALRKLAGVKYSGVVQLMSGRVSYSFDDVMAIGKRYGLRMLPPLAKPFRLTQLRAILRQLETTRGGAATAAGTGQAAEPSSAPITLASALADQRLELWFQPKFDLKTLDVVGLECLVRARRDSGEIVGPKEFLPGASATSLQQLTERVIGRAAWDWEDFQAVKPGLDIAVNVPTSSLAEMDIPALARRFKSGQRGHSPLTIEITEDEAISDLAHVHEIATRLRIHGVRVAIDDFGTGFSSFARLRDLPFAEIKLDRSFVHDCAINSKNAALCRTIVELADRLGAVAVAEGIEQEADLVCLREMGCAYGQGFLLASPMTKAETMEFLRRKASKPTA